MKKMKKMRTGDLRSGLGFMKLRFAFLVIITFLIWAQTCRLQSEGWHPLEKDGALDVACALTTLGYLPIAGQVD